MNYLRALYTTYENNLDEVGKIATKETKDKKIIEYMLLPISHTTQTAHIEVTVNLDGTLFDAAVINKISTILPFTEESGSRAGKNYVPHILHDKLMYVAGDYVAYTNDIEKSDAFQKYLYQLQEWCDSSYGHKYIKAIHEYVKRGKLIHDLIDRGILHLNDKGVLLSKWEGESEEKPEIFSVITGDQESALVRFNVHVPGEITEPIWRNIDIFDSYINFYNTKLKENDICYVSGENIPIIKRHPNKLRNSGDKAKLISANDSTGFTFRGRFKGSLEAANISYDVSQKAHNALKWLIERQGKTIDGRVFLIWGSKSPDIPNVTEDISENELWDINSLLMNMDDDENCSGDTKEVLARQYRQVLMGLKKSINLTENEEEKIYVLTIDAATPGRLAVLYYRDFQVDDYLEKLMDWHIAANWRQIRKKDDCWVEYFGSPSFYTIARAAYGPRPSDKVVKGVIERLLPCVLDGQKVPLDIIKNAIVRASNPQYFENSWEWEQVLTVACSLVKKHYEKEEYSVALDITKTNRDYLFGRLLAVADVLERSALDKDERRATNALRYMNVFQSNPLRTWNTIHKNLQPYMMKLGTGVRRYTDLFSEIHTLFQAEEFNNKPLTGKYLLGYYSQRQELYKKKEEIIEGENN